MLGFVYVFLHPAIVSDYSANRLLFKPFQGTIIVCRTLLMKYELACFSSLQRQYSGDKTCLENFKAHCIYLLTYFTLVGVVSSDVSRSQLHIFFPSMLFYLQSVSRFLPRMPLPTY